MSEILEKEATKVEDQIKVIILADSVSESGARLTTFELTYHRYFHAEFMTHRMLSKNAASCLHGDTRVYFDLPNGVSSGKKSKYSMPISELYTKWTEGNTYVGKSKLKTINTSKIDPSQIYKEADLSRLLFDERTRLGTIRRTSTNPHPYSLTPEGFFVKGADFIKWAEERTSISRTTGSLKTKIKAMHVRCLDESTGIFTTSHISNVMHSGKKEVFLVELEGGYSVKCSKEHRLFSNTGWTTLEGMGLTKIGSNGNYAISSDATIACNGQPAYQSVDWLKTQRSEGKTLRQIAVENAWDEKAVRHVAEKHKLNFRNSPVLENESLLYLDKEWLKTAKEVGNTNGRIAELCNTTEDRVKKACQKLGVLGFTGSVLRGGQKRAPWNTGLTYQHSPEVLEKLRNNPKMYPTGESNPNWKGGKSSYAEFTTQVIRFLAENRVAVMEKHNWKCAISGRIDNLELHHIDPVWNNKDLAFSTDNLMVLTNKIHRRIHALNLDLAFRDWVLAGNNVADFKIEGAVDYKSIGKPVAKSKLAAKFSKILKVSSLGMVDTYDLEIMGDWHNFVADGVVVHNSRAIPTAKLLGLVTTDPMMPTEVGKNKAGMQASENLDEAVAADFIAKWKALGIEVAAQVKVMGELGAHKQIVNRPLEAWLPIKVVATGTDWDNFFELRDSKYAQPEFADLAKKMRQALAENTPKKLEVGEWHLPYVSHDDMDYVAGNQGRDVAEYWQTLCALSSARCARVSHALGGLSKKDIAEEIEKGRELFKVKHQSPFEHVATPWDVTDACERVHGDNTNDALDQLTHWLSTPNSQCPSWADVRNLRGWRQLRSFIELGDMVL